jgi:carboxymethylenebutenolidase
MIPRRTIVQGLAGLPLAAVLADPVLAQAAADTTRLVKIQTAGGREVAGALAIPEKRPAPAILLVHEWWGLNDQIKAVAAELAAMGYLALAVDLFNGRVASSVDQAREIMSAAKEDESADTMAAWLQWLSNHNDSTRKTGTIGWCYGGGWSLRGSTLVPVDATVVYYGRVNLPKDQLKQLKGPVQGHYGKRDKHINEDIVRPFEQAMTELGKPFEDFWYDADHAFANPTGNNFQKAEAQLAWQRTTEFFAKHLRG